jgi:uncharacterized membrane protein
MRRRFTFPKIFVLALAIAAAAPVHAMPQHGTSTLAGIVLGADGKPVANASVTYQSGGGVAPHAVHTDSNGKFSVSKLRADIYDVRASSQGVYSDWQRNVSLRTGQTKTVTLRLTHSPTPTPAAAPSQP